jgi:hypothetical protein
VVDLGAGLGVDPQGEHGFLLRRKFHP